jgi:DNA repair protein RecO (recombination protein O)
VSATYHDRGIVLRTHKLGEADRILVLLTAEHGKVRCVAKGVRKTTSRFGGRVEPLAHITVLMREGRSLDQVGQAETIDHFRPLREDLGRLGQAMSMVEAIDQVAPEREPDIRRYQMLLGALRTLAANPAPLLVPAFFLKLLAELDSCASCGSPGPLVAFDVDAGGTLCRNCRRGLNLSNEALALTRAVLGGELRTALDVQASPATHEVEVLATKAMEHHIERRLRSVSLIDHGDRRR